MPNLGDFLGQLLSEITIARMQADLEAVRVAELYASHPLLRNMTVPRFRLPDIEIDVPVLIESVGETPPAARGTVDAEALRTRFDEVLTAKLREKSIRPTAAASRRMAAALDSEKRRQAMPAALAGDTNRAADRFAIVAGDALADQADRETIAALKSEVRAEARAAFLELRTPPPRLAALVTSKEVREAGTQQQIARIHLKITEEGMEVTQIERDGELEDRLLPE